jgi:hypothetical protein
MIWYDMIYDMIWYMIWYIIRYMIWYDMIWCGMIWYDMIYAYKTPMTIYASTVLGCCTSLENWNLQDEVSVTNKIYITEIVIRNCIYIYLKSLLCLWLKYIALQIHRICNTSKGRVSICVHVCPIFTILSSWKIFTKFGMNVFHWMHVVADNLLRATSLAFHNTELYLIGLSSYPFN